MWSWCLSVFKLLPCVHISPQTIVVLLVAVAYPIPEYMEPLLRTPLEAAQLLKISRSKCYELIAKGQLPSITLGCSLRIPLDELRDFIRDRVVIAGSD